MGNITLKVGEIQLDIEANEREVQLVNAMLLQAFEKLAQRLETHPLSRSINVPNLVYDRLQIGPFTVQELLSDRGADRLAEDLYKQLVGGR
jgi:hypothetical protein